MHVANTCLRGLGGGQGCQYKYKLRELGAQDPWEEESELQKNVHGRPELRNGQDRQMERD